MVFCVFSVIIKIKFKYFKYYYDVNINRIIQNHYLEIKINYFQQIIIIPIDG